MNDLIEFYRSENFFDGGPVSQIAVDEFKRFGEGLNVPQVALFEVGRIKRVQIIESPNGVAVAEQLLANMRPYESRAASNQKSHQKSAEISPERRAEVKNGRRRFSRSVLAPPPLRKNPNPHRWRFLLLEGAITSAS